MPTFIYGTAWKKESTTELVRQAVAAGFSAIDTANQKKHYREDFVGDALLEIWAEGAIRREDLFLQSKYTYKEGQDHRLPYDPAAPWADQVRASFESSLRNLHTDYLDSFLLHGPRSARGMTDADWEVWAVMEELRQSGQAKAIGVSNVGIHHLKELCARAKVKPAFVQNRCFAIQGWDAEVREYCLANRIVYQGFSLLTANPHVADHPAVTAIARRLEATPEQVIFAFAVKIGILPLTGTTRFTHMKQDLESLGLELSAGEIAAILTV